MIASPEWNPKLTYGVPKGNKPFPLCGQNGITQIRPNATQNHNQYLDTGRLPINVDAIPVPHAMQNAIQRDRDC